MYIHLFETQRCLWITSIMLKINIFWRRWRRYGKSCNVADYLRTLDWLVELFLLTDSRIQSFNAGFAKARFHLLYLHGLTHRFQFQLILINYKSNYKARSLCLYVIPVYRCSVLTWVSIWWPVIEIRQSNCLSSETPSAALRTWHSGSQDVDVQPGIMTKPAWCQD